MTTNNKISNLINSQVPFFVRNDHQKFISFIEAYYEYLEQANTTVQYGKTVERAKNLLNYIDVDKTLDGFAEHLYSYYLHNFPKDAKGDKSLILKHAKDFYRAKGTQKSVDFLMRVLFNQEPTYYYPKDDILRASDGKWFVQKSLRITDTKIDGTANSSIAGLQKYVGTRIRGLSSNAEATIESTDTFYEFGTRIDELSISSIKGTFDDGEGIITYYTNENGETKTITSNVFGGIVNSITITNGGSQYQVGDPVLIVSATGSGACAKVALVSAGDVASISVLEGGAGFQNNDYVLITGGLGSGANAQVSAVSPDGLYHPPSYNIVSSIIALEAETPINNTKYSNLNSSITNPVNEWIQNSLSFFAYSNTGPVRTLVVNDKGTGYASLPNISIIANTRISELGILGRMNIVSRGSGYSNTDWIEFINVPGGYGSGANANVIVNATGSIIGTKFTPVIGQIVGGSGYSQSFLPTANIVTSTGSNGSIEVVSVLGDGETLIASNTTIGTIQRIVIESGGSGYKEVDTVDLTGSGDGTAQTVLGVVQGVYEYPGRWLNDDGQLSSYNFLQDRDYYQNYSYVVRIKESIDNYRKALKDLIHPAGMKLFGEYVSDDDTEAKLPVTTAQDEQIVKFYDGDYNRRTGNLKNIVITLVNHGQAEGNTVYLEFIDQESNVNTITILDGGAGYNANGYLYFTGDGSGANASYTFIPNSIARIGIVDGGAGYNANGYLSVTGAGGTGANISYTILPNSILSVIVTSAGAGFNTNGYMLITGGSNAKTVSANISFTTKSNNINNIIITNPGEGYNSNGFMTFTGGNGGSNANVGYFIKTNNISSITISNGGVGYNSNGFMTFTGGGGGNANVGFIFKPNYVMSPIYITNNGGAGYNSNGFIIVTGASGTTANISYRAATNALFSISITNGGTGYNANGFVTVSGDSNAFSTGNVSYTIKTENVQSLRIASGGAGYNVPSGNLVFTGGSFTTGANGTFTTSPNSVLSINIVSPGSNVNQNGFLTFTSTSGINFNAAYIVGNTVNGQVSLPANTRQRGVVRIDINNVGIGFTDIPTINITSTGFVANLVYPTLTANMQNTINVITLTERGSGYLGVPTLTANTTNVTPAVLVVNMQNLINSVTINNPGAGYLTIPTITANGSNISPATFSVQMQNSIISATVVNAGSNYNVMPTFTIAGSNIAPATVKIDMQNTIGSVIINSRGNNYTGVPVITANGSNITPATFVTNMQNLINNVIIYSRGDSYTNGVVVTANGSNSVPATFTTFMQNIIDQVIVNNTGTFYIGTPTLTPDVTYTTPATFKLITKNSIANLAIVNPGKGFTALPVANAIGSNASPAVFQIITQNVINSVTINNPGDMFLYAPQITAIGSNSTPALFTANLINLPLPNSGIFKVQNVQNANAFIVSQNTSLAQTIGNVSVGLIVT